MENFSKMTTKFSFFLATSLMLISCGGSDSRSNSGSESSNQQVIKPIPNAKVVYVCADGKTDANGSSWETCTAKIQDAITKAQTDNKDLWFLAGEYILNETIILDKDTKLFGGFKGTENELKDRKLDTNATILSGDEKIRVLKTENLSDKSVLDGFVITQGKNEYLGAGMHNKNSNILIKNVIFSKNTAKHNGGAMYNETSNPRLMNISFIKNYSKYYGGAIHNKRSNPTIINASFSQNNADLNGGAINNGQSTLTLINATFSQNTAKKGGAIHGIDSFSPRPTIINSTFTKNTATSGGDAIFSLYENQLTIKNSILWGNGTNEIEYEGITPVISNSIIKGAVLIEDLYKENNNHNKDPKLSEAKTKIVNGVTHVYYELEANSPAINAGNSDDNNETTDQVGNNRKNGVIDIGAIEKQQ